jgi:hypothetical protein
MVVMSRFPSFAVHYHKTDRIDLQTSFYNRFDIVLPESSSCPDRAISSQRIHATSQPKQALCVVRLANGQRKTVYLGTWQSAASRAEYARIVALVSANGGIYPESAPDLTINEALVRYIKHVDAYYVDPEGRPCRSADNIKNAVGYLKRLFGRTQLAEFGPPEFKAIRAELLDSAGRSRSRPASGTAADEPAASGPPSTRRTPGCRCEAKVGRNKGKASHMNQALVTAGAGRRPAGPVRSLRRAGRRRGRRRACPGSPVRCLPVCRPAVRRGGQADGKRLAACFVHPARRRAHHRGLDGFLSADGARSASGEAVN